MSRKNNQRETLLQEIKTLTDNTSLDASKMWTGSNVPVRLQRLCTALVNAHDDEWRDLFYSSHCQTSVEFVRWADNNGDWEDPQILETEVMLQDLQQLMILLQKSKATHIILNEDDEPYRLVRLIDTPVSVLRQIRDGLLECQVAQQKAEEDQKDQRRVANAENTLLAIARKMGIVRALAVLQEEAK